MKTMQICAGIAALMLAACSGHDSDVAASATTAPDANAVASSPQAMAASAPVAGSGEMQALLAKLAPPARSAVQAAVQFTWKGGVDPVPAGALAASMDALNDAEASWKTRTQAADAQATATSLPPQTAAIAHDPGAQQAMEKKLAGMSQQEKIAWAMQMAAGQAQHMQDQMQQQAQQITDADQAAQEKFSGHLQQITMQRNGSAMTFAQATAEKDQIEQQARAAHQAIDHDLEVAIRQIPYQQEGEGDGGCYSTVNARHVYGLKLQAADKHVAQADRDLEQAGKWADKLHAMLERPAADDDALYAELAAIRHSFTQNQNLLMASADREATLAYFGHYVKGVRDFDLDATQWVRAREQRHKEDWSLLDCNVNHG